jgi:probable DNA metabolism protein
MHVETIRNRFDDWRSAARRLLAAEIPPAQVWWEELDSPQSSLLATDPCFAIAGSSSADHSAAQKVPAKFIPIAARVACFRDPQRWSLLYRILWRIVHGENHLLEIPIDDDTRRVETMDSAVRRDAHKMTAFVRFRCIEREGREYFVAWHRPEHRVVRLTTDFFVRRFGGMNWSILTPDECVHWDQSSLTFTAGVDRSAAPTSDDLESLWGTYYSHIFNPARIKVAAMKREMPVKYWSALPEAQLIPQLLKDAPKRVELMMARKIDEYPTAAAFMPEHISLPGLREAAAGCKGCPLYKNATQTVFGEGRKTSSLVMIGEQPGDQEDLAGKPFVGPAGKILDEALVEAGIDRQEVYVTNAVKHFKWTPKGKRRIHGKPNSREIHACVPWLEAELQLIKPQLIICLGATAATLIAPLLATAHPSAILRMPDKEARDQAYQALVADLKIAADELKTAQ